jgi:MerR family transcriptional regulator, copper efflux regulator
MDTLTIGQLAERTGFTPAALRFYDDRGLVTPSSRSGGGYRLYSDDALDRLAFIARAKQLGCSLDEIADLLAICDDEQCAPVQARFHELVTDKIRATQTQIAELLAFSSQLQAAAGRLATAPVDEPCSVACACLSPDDDQPVPVEFGTTTSGAVPIACTLQPGQMPDRIADWQRLLDAATTRSRTPDGRIRVEFGAGLDVAELASVVQAEQQCCAFFAFALTIDERGTALEVGAPAEGLDIVASMFGSAS